MTHFFSWKYLTLQVLNSKQNQNSDSKPKIRKFKIARCSCNYLTVDLLVVRDLVASNQLRPVPIHENTTSKDNGFVKRLAGNSHRSIRYLTP